MLNHPDENREFFLGVSLPKKESQLVMELRQIFEQGRVATSPPHITIKQPFIYHFDQTLIDLLSKWAKEQSSFFITLNKIGSFKHAKYATVFLAPDKSEKIKQLESSLSSTISYLPDSSQFVPHLTIANHLTEDQVPMVKNFVRLHELSIELKINSLTLFEHQRGQVWQIRQTFAFKD